MMMLLCCCSFDSGSHLSLSLSLCLTIRQHGLHAQNSPLLSLFINIEGSQDHPSILDPFHIPLRLTFHFLHLSLFLLFSYTFFSPSFYLFNHLSSIKIFWVTESSRFSSCIVFPSGNSHCGYASGSHDRHT